MEFYNSELSRIVLFSRFLSFTNDKIQNGLAFLGGPFLYAAFPGFLSGFTFSTHPNPE